MVTNTLQNEPFNPPNQHNAPNTAVKGFIHGSTQPLYLVPGFFTLFVWGTFITNCVVNFDISPDIVDGQWFPLYSVTAAGIVGTPGVHLGPYYSRWRVSGVADNSGYNLNFSVNGAAP